MRVFAAPRPMSTAPRAVISRQAPKPRPTQNSRRVAARAAEDSDSNNFALAPSKPTTPFGQMLAYYLQMEPGLFESAVEAQFERIKSEQEASSSDSEASSSSDMSLVRLNERIRDVQGSEHRATVEDLMYLSILGEFLKLGVEMMPKLDNYLDLEPTRLNPLMEGVHSKEALEMVKEHLTGLLGGTELMPPTTTMKMSKLQMVQVYAASVMFGYFLRRVDKRYQLARSMGMLPQDEDKDKKEDAVSRLERLFSMASESDDPDSVRMSDTGSSGSPSSSSMDSTANDEKKSPADPMGSADGPRPELPTLRKYISTFDKQTLMETAAIMSREGASLLDRQCKALWGDVNELQKQMQQVIGVDTGTLEELMQRAEAAVREERVETVTMSLSGQRRAVLEAVAYGTFLRDVEMTVDDKYGLLTPLPAGGGPGHQGPGLLPNR